MLGKAEVVPSATGPSADEILMDKEFQKREYATYHVGLKILLKKGSQFLFLRDAKNQHLDMPGGRIDNVEHRIPLIEILDREVKEELGTRLIYKLGKPVFQFRRHWDEKDVHIFITIFEADYISGEIELSSEHSSFQWIDPSGFGFEEKEFFSKEEFLAFQTYFNEPR